MKYIDLSSCLLSFSHLLVVSFLLIFGNLSSSQKVQAVPCAPNDNVEGLGLEYPFTDLGKLSVVGFDTTVNYVTVPTGKVLFETKGTFAYPVTIIHSFVFLNQMVHMLCLLQSMCFVIQISKKQVPPLLFLLSPQVKNLWFSLTIVEY